MKKAMFFVLLLLGVIVLWKGKEIIPLNLQRNFLNITHDVKEAILPHSGSDTLVIEFTDGEDLLAKLRAVETGQKIELRQKEGQSTRYVDTGISCKDDAAKAAYMEKANREREQLNKDINAELKRIQQIP